MVIRSEQRQALADLGSDVYVSSAVEHLERYSPALATGSGRVALEKFARHGLSSAKSAGFTSGPTLQLYLELMVTFGAGFDSDPQYGWLHPYLQPAADTSAVERARLLHFHAISYLDRAFGVEREHALSSLRRGQEMTIEQVRKVDLEDQAMRLVGWIHPQRAAFLEVEAVRILVRDSRGEALKLQLPVNEGKVVVFLMKFAFGHMVLSDPLYAWVGNSLDAQKSTDAQQRLERLVERLRTYLASVERSMGGART